MTPAPSQTQTPDSVMTFTAIQADATTDELPTRIHLLRAGKFNTRKYGKVNITGSDLQEMVDNFNKGVGLPFDGSTGAPVDFAHQNHLKAAAWVKGLETDGQDLWGTPVEWSTAGEAAIKGKEYKCFSSEFHPKCFGEWSDPENSDIKATNVFVGGGLTNKPMFTGNRPLTASESSDNEDGSKSVIYIKATEKEQNMNIDQIRVKASSDLNDDERKFVEEHKSELSADEQTKFGLKADDADADKDKGDKIVVKTGQDHKVVTASAVKGDEGVVTMQASEVKGMNDRIENLETVVKASQKKEVEAEVDKHIARGAIVADQKGAWVDQILASEAAKDMLAKLPDNKLVAGESGKDAKGENMTTANEELATKAAAKALTEGINIKQALEAVKAAEPALNDRAIAESKEAQSVTN